MRKVGVILEALAAGVDPRTGELLEGDHVLNDAQVRGALEEALKLVSLRTKDLPVENVGKVDTKYVNHSGRLNAGRPWTQEDDDMLRRLWKRKASMEEMCEVLQRRKRGILNRVEYLTSLKQHPLPDDLHAPSSISRSHMSWSEKDDEHLKRMVQLHEPLESICEHLGRSELSVFARIKKQGLLSEYITEEEPKGE